MPLVADDAKSDKEESSEDAMSKNEEDSKEEDEDADKPMNGGDDSAEKKTKKKPITTEEEQEEKQDKDDDKRKGGSAASSENEEDDKMEKEEKKEEEKDDDNNDDDDNDDKEEDDDDEEEKDNNEEEEEEEENSKDEVKIEKVKAPPVAKKSPMSNSPPVAVPAAAAAVPAPEESADEQSSTWKPQVLPADFTPSPAHVLCGRRKGHKDFGGNWPGNLALEEVIAEHLPQYESADESEKNEIIQKILDQVRRCKGGFVRISLLVDDDKNSQQRWMDVGDANARKDVAAIFRLFMQSRRLRRQQQEQGQTAGHQQKHQPLAHPPPPPAPPKGTSPEVPYAQLQNVAKARPTVGPPTTLNALKKNEKLASPTLALPTKLYAVEKSGGDTQSKTPILRKRTTAALENSIHATAAMEMAAPKRFSASFPGVPPAPVQFERPKKRRSVEENLAADALQLIAKASSTVDDESTTNSTPTVRRRSGANMARPRPSMMETESGRKTDVCVCCLQLGQRQPSESPWDAVQRALACLTSVAQSEQDVDLFVLPELSPFGSSLDTFTKYLPLSNEWQHLYQRVDEAFAEHAKILQVYIVYGTIGWYVRETDRSLRFKLSHKVVDRQGKIVAVHDKAYLSDLEFRFFDAGHRKTVTFHIDGFAFGLLVGDDLKYPNLARGLARDNDVDVLVNPSADSIPLYFRQCRAVENSIYVLGVEYNTGMTVACPPDPDHDPISMEAQDEEGEEGYLMTRIQRTALEYARTNFSHYRRMKTEVR